MSSRDRLTAPFGTWPSPITTELITADAVRLGGVAIDGGDLYWLEGRPSESGRNVLVRLVPGGAPADVTPAPFDVRTRVHEYGGGAFAVHEGTVWFCHDADQRVYALAPGERAPRPVTAPGPWRYADLLPDPGRQRLIAVREDHGAGGTEPVNELVAIDLAGGAVSVLARGHDFYASPSLAPEGRRLAWLTWDHPHMPWQASTAWVATVEPGGGLGTPVRVAGGPGESIFQPRFGPDGALYLVSDRTGWWNLYRSSDGGLDALAPRAAEFGRPQWQLGMRTFGFAAGGELVCAAREAEGWRLYRLAPGRGPLEPLSVGLTEIDALAVGAGTALVVGGAPDRVASVVAIDLASGEERLIRHSVRLDLDPRALSRPEPIEFPTGEAESAHAYLYRPASASHRGPPGERPPLLVVGHGGPTAATSTALDLRIQFWTSRGFCVLDVDYRGSTGYGRPYRERLAGQWGVVDVEDCVAGARHLAGTGVVDPARLAIRGSSAGGYTALAAVTFHDVFTAAASFYGISDLETLARDTHKFESRYLDWLIGPYPEARERYRERSPIHFADRISCPVIFLQGLEDRVVPPAQAEAMVRVLRERGLPVVYLEFPGEQHGFRRAETIRRALEAEVDFYAGVWRLGDAGAASGA